MRWFGLPLLLLAVTVLAAQPALTFPPPKVTLPDKETLDAIEARAQKLETELARLTMLKIGDPGFADVEVFLKGVRRVVKLGQYYDDSAKAVLPVLDHGLLRANLLARGETSWLTAPGQSVARAYRSRIDGSVQPFAVTYPHDYGQDRRKRYRVDVVLHGRSPGLTEVTFLHRFRGGKEAPKDLAHVRIDIYGRGNNAYRWAGESDVYEAIENFFAVEALMGRQAFIDVSRVVLRGFSMGGAGTWHLGLHRPDQFVVLGPGAGFTTTHGYAKDLPAKLPDYQEACLRIYDAADYAENLFNVPVVAYSGEEDEQIAAARNIEKRVKPLGLSFTHLIAPNTKHKLTAEWEKKLEVEYAKAVEPGKPEYPTKVRFVTYTLRYQTCAWVDLIGLDRHYTEARVEAEKLDDGFAVKTKNVRALRLGLWPSATREPTTVAIDGQKLEGVRPVQARTGELSIYLEKRDGTWTPTLPERLLVDRLRTPQKTAGLQGPIDDAFMAPFLCVRGTGKPWHEATEEYARGNLERFRDEWARHFRGELPIKDDTEVTAEDIGTKHLILFGDPGSNTLIREVVGKLPMAWTPKAITFGGEVYDASRHVPAMVYPSPLAADRYVVLNSGHTFHAEAYEGTNALLYPRLGDHAILELAGTKAEPLAVNVKAAGLFDEFWRLPPRP